jgi:putative flippase GtrA
MKKVIAATLSLPASRKELVTQAGKYFIVGGFCTLIDFALLFYFTHFFKINYLLSSVISFMSATILNYYLCTYWIFKVRSVENKHLEFLYYILITGVGLGINSLLIWFCTAFLGYYFMLSKLFATFVTFWWNFGARKYFLHNQQ